MPNGKLYGYNKLNGNEFVIGDITGSFSIEDNINETASNMKVKIVNSTREEYEVNTVCYHQDFDTWWVIKSDESTYITTGEYEHSLQLVEYFEIFNFRHLVDCAFKKDDYTLDDMLRRIFRLGNVGSIAITYPSFLSSSKKNDFFSFENFTVASAIKAVARSYNAIPKLVGSIGGSEGAYYLDTPTLTFISRNGLQETPRTTMNSIFSVQYEKNSNSADQFQTRAISNLGNVLANDLVIAPKIGGYLAITKDNYKLDTSNGIAVIQLPSKIDRIDFIKLFPKIKIRRVVFSGTYSGEIIIYDGYYTNAKSIYDLIQTKKDINGNTITYSDLTDAQLASIIMPSTEEFGKIKLNDGYGSSYYDSNKPFAGYLTLKDDINYNLIQNTTEKSLTFWYRQKTNELNCATKFIKGLQYSIPSPQEFQQAIVLKSQAGSGYEERVELFVASETTGYFGSKLSPYTTYIQVGYVPIGDLKISYDNDNNAQDEKFFNQSGKLLDAFAVSKLMLSHVQDSVDGTKIRQAKHEALGDIIPLGALIQENGTVYVITQRSIDYINGYYSVSYSLSRNRIARSENVTADGSIRDYAVPENNIVRRTQLYKDYIELSLDETHTETPYLPLLKSFELSSTIAGSNFDYMSLAKCEYSTQTPKYIGVSTSNYDLYKSKVVVSDFINNAISGYSSSLVSSEVIQTPQFYTGTSTVNGNTVGNGKVDKIKLVLMDEEDVATATTHYVANNTGDANRRYIPFIDLTNVPANFYNTSTITQGNYVAIFDETNYKKDAFEVPVFQYQIQANDTISLNNSVIIGERLFTAFKGDIRYHYVVSTSKFTTENADSKYDYMSYTTRVVDIIRTSGNAMTLNLYSSYTDEFTNTPNSVALQGKHIGIYAEYYVDTTRYVKFLFAINDYNKISNSSIDMYINNWKI